jgi:hypothetical protein
MDQCIFCLCDNPPTYTYNGICNCHPSIHTECLNKWYDINPNTCPICLIKYNVRISSNRIKKCMFNCMCFLLCMFVCPMTLIWIVIGLSISGSVYNYRNMTIEN